MAPTATPRRDGKSAPTLPRREQHTMFHPPLIHRCLSGRFAAGCLSIVCVLFTVPLKAEPPGDADRSADAALTAEAAEAPISFVNDVMPVLTKAGCNAGVCHAKAGGGQNGFQLSLLGYEPAEDYRHLVLEGRGRRLFPLQPDRSLLLMKACGDVPHGGGVRFEKDSDAYQI